MSDKDSHPIRYCVRCVMPHTKPDLRFDEEGVCNARRSFESRVQVDWEARKKQLMEILGHYSSDSGVPRGSVFPGQAGHRLQAPGTE